MHSAAGSGDSSGGGGGGSGGCAGEGGEGAAPTFSAAFKSTAINIKIVTGNTLERAPAPEIKIKVVRATP